MLAGRRCVITGGSRGLGLAIAQRFAEEGAAITVISRDQTSIDRAVETLDSISARHNYNRQSECIKHGGFSYDVSRILADGGFPQKLFEQAALHRMAQTDILVNCAGVSQQSLLMRTSINSIDQIVSTNLLGTIYMCKAFIKPMMVAAGRKASDQTQPTRHIINMSSILAHRGGTGSSVYSGAKAGIEGFSRALAMELAQLQPAKPANNLLTESRAIRVNCLSIGLANTQMGQEAGEQFQQQFTSRAGLGIVDPQEVAQAALYLVGTKQVTGTVLHVDSGYD